MADTKAPNTPRKRAARREAITNEEIAARAYEISQSDVAGSDDENWLRAERELQGTAPDAAP